MALGGKWLAEEESTTSGDGSVEERGWGAQMEGHCHCSYMISKDAISLVHDICQRTCARTLADGSDVVGIPSKSGDEFSDPRECRTLVAKKVVAFVTSRTELFGSQQC